MGRIGLQQRPADRDARDIRSSTATGWAPRARRRSCSTATTTCSRSIRSSCGRRRRSRRRCATANSTRAASADDKGQVFMHFKAIEAHLKQNGKLPVNIKFVIEGEEEVGSSHLDDFVREHKASWPPTSSSFPIRRCSIAASRRSATACAAWPTSRSICAARRAICTQGRSAAPWPTRRWCWRRCWRR